MAQLPTYSSRNVSTSFLGYTLEGLAPDSFIEFQLNTDLTDTEVGADGSVSISLSPDETGTCTISLQQNSPSNVFLSGVLNLQRASGQLAKGSFTVNDPSGSVVALLTGAHIQTPPTISLGSSASGKTQDWKLFCEKITWTTLPNGLAVEAGSLLADAVAAVENVTAFLT